MTIVMREPTSRGFERSPYRFRCDQPFCEMEVTAKSEADAQHVKDIHTCPHLGGPTKIGWTVTKTLVAQMWEKLDLEVDIIKSIGANPAELEALKLSQTRARAYSDCIALFMQPFFSTPDEVARESTKRWRARKAGEKYETPGMGHRRYEHAAAYESAAAEWYTTPDGGYSGDPTRAGAPAKGRSARAPRDTAASRKLPVGVSTKTASEVKLFSASFSHEQLATTYGMSVEDIKTILNVS